MNPPIRPHTIDLLYSSGVIHHTPSTELTFSCLVPLLKPGSRCYIWLYHPQPTAKHWLMLRLRQVVKPLPSWLQLPLPSLFTALALAKRSLARLLRLTGEPQLNWREQLINFYDGLTPPFRHEHTQDEVRRWFAKREFVNAVCTIDEQFGFGMYADWQPGHASDSGTAWRGSRFRIPALSAKVDGEGRHRHLLPVSGALTSPARGAPAAGPERCPPGIR